MASRRDITFTAAYKIKVGEGDDYETKTAVSAESPEDLVHWAESNRPEGKSLNSIQCSGLVGGGRTIWNYATGLDPDLCEFVFG